MSRLSVNALGGAYLNFSQVGSGFPLVFLHGFTGNRETWRAFGASVSKYYKLVTVDLPGHGESDSPDSSDLYTMEIHVKALGELLDHLEFEQVAWIGYSLGGRIALGATLGMPDRSAALVLESASPGISKLGERVQRTKDDQALANWIEEAGVTEFVNYWEALPMWDSQNRLSELIRKRLRSQRLLNKPIGLANSLRGIGSGAQPQYYSRLGQINVPTLLLAGEEDRKFLQVATEMDRNISNCSLKVVSQAGHCIHLEQPVIFKELVFKFLKENLHHEAIK
ncbi:MAG: 2-succinyl-6-hydroxy-2,4-cyclohexadiene-1-carboxylate synthase [Chloroflexi bacterium]|nr:MAG: 2-succinyl-6-hydroxy-2,4-cyclohexadiene-1-carboxylate synthase [Chloroflexota bacterium]